MYVSFFKNNVLRILSLRYSADFKRSRLVNLNFCFSDIEMASLLSQYKSAITLSFVFFCVSTPPSQTLEAFDIEFNHFNLVSFNLTLDPSSMFNPNISIVQFEGVGKYGYDSNLKSVSEPLCMPPDNSGKWSR